MSCPRYPAAVLALVPVLLAAAPAPGDQPLSPQQARGREIYLRGTSPAGAGITAVLEGDVEVPAAALPCANCHGRDGRGRPEGGVTPADLRWDVLTRPYGVTHPGGRSHPPYTARLLKRAISLGLDPAGNRLHTAMPRYRMSQADMADLVAYLEVLGREPVPGVTAAAVRLGALVPEGPAGAAVRTLLAAYFARVNREGGVYGRRLELVAAPLPRAEPRTPAARFLDAEPVFALAVPFPGAGAGLAPLFAEREVPALVAASPGSSSGDAGTLPDRHVFHLLASPEDQVRALVAFARQGQPPGPLALVAGTGELSGRLAGAAAEEASRLGWTVLRRSLPPGEGGEPAAEALARDLAGAGAGALFFAGPGRELARLLAAAERTGWHPRVLVPGTLAGPEVFDLPPALDGRVFLSYPTLPLDPASPAAADLRELAGGTLPAADLAAHVSAVAAARLLVEGLRRAGRELTRDRLVEALEGIADFDTGLLPPLTYGPGRRLGARGAYVVRLDLRRQTFAPASGWLEVR